MRFAKDVMTPNPKSIPAEERLIDTLELFFKNGIHYAPVVNKDKQVLGMLSETALVRATLRNYLDAGRNELVGAHQQLLEIVPFVGEDAPIQEVMNTMMASPCKRVLVQDGNRQLVGIISPKDILRKIHAEHIHSMKMADDLKGVGANKDLHKLQDIAHVYKAMFENSPSLMHSVDNHKNVIMANRRLHAELGYADGELIGRKVYDLYPANLHAEVDQALQQIKASGYNRSTISQMLKKDGKIVHVDVCSSSLKDVNDSFLSTITVSRIIEDSKDLLTSLD